MFISINVSLGHRMQHQWLANLSPHHLGDHFVTVDSIDPSKWAF